jgi:membrane-bound lytic murein transglycosylase D
VKRKDNLVNIAQLFDVRVSDIRNWNNLPYTSTVKVGQDLTIYVPKDKIEYFTSINKMDEGEKKNILFVNSGDNYVEHKIKNGESLRSIANMYGVSVTQLKEWNNLKSNHISRGKKLMIYSGDSRRVADNKSLTNGRTTKYKVKHGDSLGEIAEKFGVTTLQLRKWNQLSSNRIVAGKSLIVHGRDNTSSLGDNTTNRNSNIVRYTIMKGDTIGEIAEKYGVSTDDIKNWNNMKNNKLISGKSISIYSDNGEDSETSSKPSKNTNRLSKNNSSSEHVVKNGEALSTIADKYNVTVKELKEWNDLDGSKIKVGQTLVVSKSNKKGSVAESKSSSKNKSLAAKTHKVREGESLWTIAKNYGVVVADIISWNNLKSDKVKVGQMLKIF